MEDAALHGSSFQADPKTGLARFRPWWGTNMALQVGLLQRWFVAALVAEGLRGGELQGVCRIQ